MKISKNILEIDHAIQSLIIGFAITSLLFAIFFPSLLIFYLLLQIAMGFWQVLSAFIIVMISGNKKRLQYLVAVAAFFLNAGLISYFLRDLVFETEIVMAIIWIALPICYAIWYYKMTGNDLKKLSKRFVNSFEESKEFENIFDAKEFV